jgi:hypothetical protein
LKIKGEKEVLSAMEDEMERQKAQFVAVAQYIAEELETYAKENAKWQDHTSNARQGLKGEHYIENGTVYALIRHSMEYGVYLELSNEKKYAILKESVNQNIDQWYKAYEKIADGKDVDMGFAF